MQTKHPKAISDLSRNPRWSTSVRRGVAEIIYDSDAHAIDATIERMAVAICNTIRTRHNLPPLNSIANVEDSVFYREQARAAYRAIRSS